MINSLFRFFFVVLIFLSCVGKRKNIQTKENIEIPYHYAFLENLSPNCDSAMIFMRNNIFIKKVSKFSLFPDNYTIGHVQSISQIKKEYNIIYGIGNKSDILMYVNTYCLERLSFDEVKIVFSAKKSNILEWDKFLRNQNGHVEVEFDNIWGGSLIFAFKNNKSEIGVHAHTKILYSHPTRNPNYSSISNAYLENRTINCDSAYIYSKRNIKPLKLKSSVNRFSKTAPAKIYIPGIDPSQSKLENLEKAQLERLFIRLDCLVGMSSSEIFELFCVKDEIPKYQKWESQWGMRKKQLQVKFKGFPSKGIYVEFDDGVVVDSGVLE